MSKPQLVWDLPIRLFHWLLVASLLVSFITSQLGTNYLQYHIYAGYSILFLLVFRLIWGFVGTKHAKFSQFLPTPSKIKQYLSQSHKTDYVGHNPLGALMVLLFIILLMLQVISGLFMSDDIMHTAPYHGALGKNIDKLMARVHDLNVYFIIGGVAAHILAIIYYLKVKRTNLTKAMITGKKEQLPQGSTEGIPHSKLLLAVVVVLITSAILYWLLEINAPIPEDEYFY